MQNKVKEFNVLMKKAHTKTMPTSSRLLDIQSELGELNKEYLKASKYGTKDFLVNDGFKMELGDVLYALLSLAEECELDVEECLQITLEKMKHRLETKQNLASGR